MRIIFLILFSIFLIGETLAQNIKPVGCESLHDPYYFASGDSKYYAFSNSIAQSRGLRTFYRVFIPPGTVTIDLLHLGIGQQKSVARYKELPAGSPEYALTEYSERYRLSDMIGKDQWIAESLQGILHIVDDGFETPLGISGAGWLYVKIGGGVSLDYDNEFLVKVDREKYNEWWNTYIHDQAGWDEFVEKVEKYILPSIMNQDFSISIPCLSYGNFKFAARLDYDVSASQPGQIIFKVATAEDISNSFCYSGMTTLSDSLDLNIPDLLLLDGGHIWVDFKYKMGEGSGYFVVTNYGSK